MANLSFTGTQFWVAFGTNYDTDGITPITPTYTQCGTVLDITPPNMSVDHYPITFLNGEWVRKFPTVKDGDKFEVEIMYDPSDSYSIALFDMFDDKKTNTVKLVFTDSGSTEFICNSFIKNFQPTGGDARQPFKLKLTMEVDGAPTLA